MAGTRSSVTGVYCGRVTAEESRVSSRSPTALVNSFVVIILFIRSARFHSCVPALVLLGEEGSSMILETESRFRDALRVLENSLARRRSGLVTYDEDSHGMFVFWIPTASVVHTLYIYPFSDF